MTPLHRTKPGFFRLHPEVLGLAGVLAVLTLFMPDSSQAMFEGRARLADCSAEDELLIFGRTRSALDVLQRSLDCPRQAIQERIQAHVQERVYRDLGQTKERVYRDLDRTKERVLSEMEAPRRRSLSRMDELSRRLDQRINGRLTERLDQRSNQRLKERAVERPGNRLRDRLRDGLRERNYRVRVELI